MIFAGSSLVQLSGLCLLVSGNLLKPSVESVSRRKIPQHIIA